MTTDHACIVIWRSAKPPLPAPGIYTLVSFIEDGKPVDFEGAAWSVVLRFIESKDPAGRVIEAEGHFLVEDAPRIESGTKLLIYEGHAPLGDVTFL